MKCDICKKGGGDPGGPGYTGTWDCPNCEQTYQYDEGARLVLSEAQLEALRKLKNSSANGILDG